MWLWVLFAISLCLDFAIPFLAAYCVCRILGRWQKNQSPSQKKS